MRRIFYRSWEMKRWMRKWWREHDTEAFGHSVVAGTMRRMHKLAKLKGMPVCDYYTVGWQQRVFASVRYVILMRGIFSNYFKICSKITKRSFEKIFTFLVDFILFLEKKKSFPPYLRRFSTFFTKHVKKKIRWGCGFCCFQNYIENLLNYGENDIVKVYVFLGHLL